MNAYSHEALHMLAHMPDQPTPPEPVLTVRGLDIRLPLGADRALAVTQANLQILPGQTLCVVGESGSGKSMIANAIMGLLPRPKVEPVAGEILFDGQDLLRLSEDQLRELRGSRMAMVFQEPMTALNPVMRIGDQMAEALDAHLQLPAADKRRRIIAALTDVGLPEPERLIDAYPFRLSGGQRQRVMIAIAMLLEPSLLIADEPTTALDVTTQAQILQLMRALQKKSGMAMLFITHDFGVVAEIADHVVVMQTGVVVEAGPARQVLRNPQHAYTKKLLAAIPHGNVRETQASFGLVRSQTLGVVGESGSGKSSLGRCIVGLAPFDSGDILFNGQRLSSGAALRRQARGKIQMVFQDPYASLNPRHKIGAAIASGPIAQGVPKAEAMRRTMELLELVGLGPEAAERYPHEFSGGQRQRIGIARALAMEPSLLVADEPVSALDVSVQAQVLKLFAEVRERFQLSMVFITHDLRVAGQMCDHLAVMQRGRIVEYGPTAQGAGDPPPPPSPQHPYTQTLIDAIPSLEHRSDEAPIAEQRSRA